MTAITLYLAPGASSMAPHIALVEAGRAFDIRALSFRAKEHRSPEYLAINRQGQVPTLVVDGTAITESLAILFWIGRSFPAAGLLPADPVGEAQVLGWMSFLASSVQRAGREGMEVGHAAYALVERRLAGREWTVGDRMSVADIHLFRMFWRFQPLLDLGRADYPGLWSLHDRMMQRDAVRRVIGVESAIGYELPGWPAKR